MYNVAWRQIIYDRPVESKMHHIEEAKIQAVYAFYIQQLKQL